MGTNKRHGYYKIRMDQQQTCRVYLELTCMWVISKFISVNEFIPNMERMRLPFELIPSRIERWNDVHHPMMPVVPIVKVGKCWLQQLWIWSDTVKWRPFVPCRQLQKKIYHLHHNFLPAVGVWWVISNGHWRDVVMLNIHHPCQKEHVVYSNINFSKIITQHWNNERSEQLRKLF